MLYRILVGCLFLWHSAMMAQASDPFWLPSSLLVVSDTSQAYEVAEVQPTPQGGMEAFNKYLSKHLHVPPAYWGKEEIGCVSSFVKFIVEKDGTLSGFTPVTRGSATESPYPLLDQELIRVIRETSPWQPGRQGGQPVRVRMVVPVFIKLG
ncbi:protein TonB [Catalinimonas alkaloidigena]|uniref:Protein TonB n=1 Tax=Catalinimonas alkaloidigena TaxID=1075417 RepID=A0A1G8WD06_9BACT|nr:energy transducer TonB [Catalinimonas alkaloidigena]SDJ75635.1 protein TonB [Catalinimonas alkaloidigena]